MNAVILIDYPMIKHVYPDGSDLLRDDNACVHRGFQYENDVNNVHAPSLHGSPSLQYSSRDF